MKGLLSFGLLAAPLVQGHYIFSQLFVDDKAAGGDYTYIRKNTNTYMPSFTSEIVNSPELRCNKGATSATAQTMTVAAGSKLGFKLWFNEFIEHPGPGMVYMSKAPGDLNSYDGSGDWFKVFESGLCGSNPSVDTDWCTWQKDRIEFTLPAATPPGDYLVRVEHIAIHEGHVGKAQFYMECAHIKVTGNGAGTPGPLVKIPGMYSSTDPGIAYNKWTGNPAPYVIPGPAVWNGAAASNSSPAPVAEDAATNTTAPSEPATSEPAAANPPANAPPSSSGASLYGQCGGQGWSGATTCAQGSCQQINQYYSQCA
ncbi:fungal cellulose binding domain-containing protein [Colletotrichum graminicola]|uniref:lytic cellulose monooxygenase (C4-dehydrogenating) n=1 Tax=Colletotrichum graminicola (strain M1.001 / M2 / FGSC 10212) TaxID=645133 RepID=E3QZY5_COLGM|nr:fungal cellulose binding domain-containing protein [Colletotrichum graminicola M1.001]EFQ36423.1 fungal cellulose binding domain-containing protein [Colletotrichum graminicola M1.001]WDK19186.1 fungal cellulose binding domain-containing protein [Colletotrichum graminicola]